MSCCATTTLVSSNPTSTGSIGMPLVRLVVAGGSWVPPRSTCGAFFYYVIIFLTASRNSGYVWTSTACMRLCCSKGIYSTTGVRGGAIPGSGAEGAVRSGLYPLYMVYFFTKLIIY